MITKDNYGEEHIRQLQIQSRKDPQLIERALYALGLLEALRQTGMDFIFKNPFLHRVAEKPHSMR